MSEPPSDSQLVDEPTTITYIHAGMREGDATSPSAHSECAVQENLGRLFRGDGNPVKRGVEQRQAGADVNDYPEEASNWS